MGIPDLIEQVWERLAARLASIPVKQPGQSPVAADYRDLTEMSFAEYQAWRLRGLRKDSNWEPTHEGRSAPSLHASRIAALDSRRRHWGARLAAINPQNQIAARYRAKFMQDAMLQAFGASQAQASMQYQNFYNQALQNAVETMNAAHLQNAASPAGYEVPGTGFWSSLVGI